MSDRENEILDSVGRAISKMTEFEKGYFLGVAESKLREKEEEEKEREPVAV